ncbi:serine/threonine protein kinase [Microbispora sp. NEAU-D428]|uniref:serine/threonine protein kinase n=1 Tax=Microbispora sitophila TaxID=2771537 RepID=UPI00186927C3|nr:serine/threonine-protein kinase [Microbispora sitophila]MBE3008108.1 serine/threonine protein kinase [Microbispora sitophila]
MEVGLDGSTADTFPTQPELQRLLPGYRLIRRLSQTPMSEVHLAEEVGLANRKVALKVLNPSVCDEPSFRERFHREVTSAAQLGHPNVIPIHQAGEAGPLLYLVMPYVEGTDLAGLLRAEGRLGLARTARIIRQVAAALDAAHGKDLVHRDVKPHNILIDRDSGHVYLCDFGIAKHVADETSSAGQFIGTIDYASPEQIKGGKVDKRTDVYSLGCVLYQCLTGCRPYPEPVPVSVMWAHLHAPPPRVTDVCPDVDGRIDDIVATALAKEPDDRYPGCAELAARLAEVVGADGGGVPPAPDLSAPPQPSVRLTASRGRRILAMLVATVLVIAIGVIVYVVSSDDLASAALARVPESLQTTCARAATGGGFPGADVSLRCRDTSGDEVVFGLFDTTVDMDEAYEAAVREAGIARGSGDCAAADTGEHRYPGVGPPKGRVLCRTAGDTRSLVWTDTSARTVARAGMPKGAEPGLPRAWAAFLGEPPFPTADERSLIDDMEAKGCKRVEPGDLDRYPEAVAGVECDPGAGATTVSYYRFTDLPALQRAYNERARRIRAPYGISCRDNPAGFLGSDRYNHKSAEVGAVLCHPEADGAFAVEWSIEPFLVLARAFGADPGKLAGWWDASSTPSLEKLAQAINARARPAFPTAAEQALLRHIPAASRVDCVRPSKEQIATNVHDTSIVGVVCGPFRGVGFVFYYQFPDRASMRRNYALNAVHSDTTCGTPPGGFVGEGAYSIKGKPAGRLTCNRNGPWYYLVWTDERLNIEAFHFKAPNPKTLIEWWRKGDGLLLAS